MPDSIWHSRGSHVAKPLARYGSRYSLDVDGFQDSDVRNLTAWAFERPERLLPLIRDYLYPQTDIFPQRIESSTHMFPMLVQNGTALSGMSGTIYNKNTYPNLFDGLNPSSHTIPLIIQRIKSNAPITTNGALKPACTVDFTDASPIEDIIKQLDNVSSGNLSCSSGWGLQAVIDTTGQIAKSNGSLFAKLLVERARSHKPTIDSVAFYQEDTLMVYSATAKSVRPYVSTDLLCYFRISKTENLISQVCYE